MNTKARIYTLASMIRFAAVSLAGQSPDSSGGHAGKKLVLVPSQPLTEPRFPRPASGSAVGPIRKERIQQASPFFPPRTEARGRSHLSCEEAAPASGDDEWRTYRVPKVEAFSRNADE